MLCEQEPPGLLFPLSLTLGRSCFPVPEEHCPPPRAMRSLVIPTVYLDGLPDRMHNCWVGIGRNLVALVWIKSQDGLPQTYPAGLVGFVVWQVPYILAFDGVLHQWLVPRHEQRQAVPTSLLRLLKQSSLGLRPEARFSFFFAFHHVPPVFSLEIHLLWHVFPHFLGLILMSAPTSFTRVLLMFCLFYL